MAKAAIFSDVESEIHPVEMPTSTNLSGYVHMTIGVGRIKVSYFLTQWHLAEHSLLCPYTPAGVVNTVQELA